MNYSCPWLDLKVSDTHTHTHTHTHTLRTFPIVPNNTRLRMSKLLLSSGKNMRGIMLGAFDVPGTNRSALSFFKTNMRRQQISDTFVSWHVLQLDAFGGSSAQLLERRTKRVAVMGNYSWKRLNTLFSMPSGSTVSSYRWMVSHNSFIKRNLIVISIHWQT